MESFAPLEILLEAVSDHEDRLLPGAVCTWTAKGAEGQLAQRAASVLAPLVWTGQASAGPAASSVRRGGQPVEAEAPVSTCAFWALSSSAMTEVRETWSLTSGKVMGRSDFPQAYIPQIRCASLANKAG